MAAEVTIPYLGHTMTKAKIVAWAKSEGEPIAEGETVLEIETDKVNYAIEASIDGVIEAILAEVGAEVPVGGVVALIRQDGAGSDLSRYERYLAGAPAKTAAPAPDQPPAQPVGPGRPETVVLVSPAAKKAARQAGLDIGLVKGTGRSGRIRLADVENHLARSKPPTRPSAAPSAAGSGLAPAVAQVIPMNSMRRAIAQRLSQSSHDAPHFSLCTEVDMTEALKTIARLRERAEAKGRTLVSLNDLFVLAVAGTLMNYPLLNARLEGDEVHIMRDINVGLAVALDDGLIVPAIESADRKKIWQIARERRDLVDRARQGRLDLSELERGTFTISNLGTFDIVSFTSILNPPQTGILSIGRTRERPVVVNGEIVIRPVAEINLAVDHRVVDGAVGAGFLQDLKEAIEHPSLLL